MARYLVTSGSHFEPMTYDELVKPLAQMTEAMNAAQERYDVMNLETSALGRYISNNPGDDYARELYNNYLNQLNTLQNNLWDNGYTSQTRRDLSAAQAGYAQDVKRLETAIKARQERSNQYWDAWHKNPELVMGADPGTSGLDNYLRDDNYGKDFYSYNGRSFTEEVALDAKTIADRMLQMPIYANNPDAAGWLMKFSQFGASPTDVDGANSLVDAVLNGDMKREDVPNNSVAGLLAGVLLSHLDSTGASRGTLDENGNYTGGNVDSVQFNRLVNYGKAGLSHAIGKSDVSDLADKQWDFQKQIALQNNSAENQIRVAREAARLKGEQEEEQQEALNMGNTVPVQSPGYEKLVSYTKNEASNYSDGQNAKVQMLNMPGENAEPVPVKNEYEMADYLYNTKARQDIRNNFDGYDIAVGGKARLNLKKKDGTTVEYKVKDTSKGFEVYNEKGELMPGISQMFNNAKQELDMQVANFKRLNGDNIVDKAISPKKQQKMREEYGYSKYADWKNFYSYVTTKETAGDFSPIILAGSDSSHSYAREDLASELISQMNHAIASTGGKIGKGSIYAIYEVGKGNLKESEEGTTDLAKVLGTKTGANGTQQLRTDTIINAVSLVDDFNSDRPKVRFQTTVNPGKVFIVDASMFGPLVYQQLTSPNRYTNTSVSSDIRQAMMPLWNPMLALEMGNSKEAYDWGYAMASRYKNFPRIKISDKQSRGATPAEIVMNPNLQKQLRDAVNMEIASPAYNKIRESIQLAHEQYHGDQSSTFGGLFFPQ